MDFPAKMEIHLPDLGNIIKEHEREFRLIILDVSSRNGFFPPSFDHNAPIDEIVNGYCLQEHKYGSEYFQIPLFCKEDDFFKVGFLFGHSLMSTELSYLYKLDPQGFVLERRYHSGFRRPVFTQAMYH